MYERNVDVDMLNAVESVLADVSSVRPSSEQRTKSVRALCSDEGLTLETSANTLYCVQHIHINLTLIHCTYSNIVLQVVQAQGKARSVPVLLRSLALLICPPEIFLELN